MVADQPLVVYPKNNDGDHEKEVTKKSMDDFYEKWKKKKESCSSAGKKIQLGDYLRNGLKK